MRKSILGIALLVASPGIVSSQPPDFNPERDSLEDVGAFCVVVETLPPEIPNSLLTREQLKTDLELKLRMAHLPLTSDSRAMLYLNVNLIPVQNGAYIYNVDLAFRQRVLILESARTRIQEPLGSQVIHLTWSAWESFTAQQMMDMSFGTTATTWNEAVLGYVGGSSDANKKIRAVVSDLCDSLMNDFLAAQEAKRQKLERAREWLERAQKGESSQPLAR